MTVTGVAGQTIQEAILGRIPPAVVARALDYDHSARLIIEIEQQ